MNASRKQSKSLPSPKGDSLTLEKMDVDAKTLTMRPTQLSTLFDREDTAG